MISVAMDRQKLYEHVRLIMLGWIPCGNEEWCHPEGKTVLREQTLHDSRGYYTGMAPTLNWTHQEAVAEAGL